MTTENRAPAPPAPHSGRPAGAVYADRGSSHFDILLAAMVTVVVLSGIGAAKGVSFGEIPGTGFEIITDGGFFLFPLAYVLGDMITELYGPRSARRAILTSFAVSILASLSYQVIIALPPFPDEYGLAKQAALELALGPVWIVVLAGLAGFLAGQSLNSFVVSRMKQRTGERGLIARLFTSSGLGELVDTIIFCSIASVAIGITTLEQWAEYTILGVLYKVIVQYAMIPATSAVIRWMKRTDPSYRERLAASQQADAAA
ncbi:queuosine precursor transporter [Brachybacterium saurashtrense]|uniref:Probable queuosine precursor transporter n=1 Tax=Brachybacterium saurashtrense TaxID=556288 RepID=A0A345YME5_9MICO|nr:queuosine precursor transporter [Brachybacterium saurashtrense]AXK45097.1 VUT family protein [Brachybacterium saurashtrense]RRR21798.1 VUT family protein [Brachybacterium saurashtrense]